MPVHERALRSLSVVYSDRNLGSSSVPVRCQEQWKLIDLDGALNSGKPAMLKESCFDSWVSE